MLIPTLLARRRYIITPQEYNNWNHSYINGLVFTILLVGYILTTLIIVHHLFLHKYNNMVLILLTFYDITCI